MKKLRNYRIKLKESDKVKCTLFELVGDSVSNSYRVALDNISTTGVGLLTNEYLDNQKIFKIEIKYKRQRITSTVQLRRFRPNFNNSGKVYLGLEFIEFNIDSIMQLMSSLVSSMSKRRLRNLMYDMVLNEAVAGSVDYSSSMASTPMLIDLFEIFRNFEDKITLISLFIFEVKRTLKAKDARLFILNDNEHSFSEFDFLTKDFTDVEYPNTGILEEIYNKPRGVKSKFSHSLSNDPFFNMYEVVNNVNITTYLMCPIFDQNENLFGVLNFSNKEAGELFTDIDLKQAMFLARLIGLLYFFNDEDEVVEIKDEFVFSSPLGTGEFAKDALKFIELYAESRDPFYVYGDEGTGKFKVCQKVIEASKSSNKNMFSINCYPSMKIEDINLEILSIQNSLLNGFLVFKGFDELGEKEANYILNGINKEGHYRVFLTGKKDLELSIGKFKCLSLKERPEDILFFTSLFIHQYALKNHTAKKKVSSDVQDFFMDYDWPGNLTELKACIARLMIFNKGNTSLKFMTSNISPILETSEGISTPNGISDLNLNDMSEYFENEDEFKDLYLYFYTSKEISNSSLLEFSKSINVEYDIFIHRLRNGRSVSIKLFEKGCGIVDSLIEKSVA